MDRVQRGTSRTDFGEGKTMTPTDFKRLQDLIDNCESEFFRKLFLVHAIQFFNYLRRPHVQVLELQRSLYRGAQILNPQ